jgi:uncharacterized membrane protein
VTPLTVVVVAFFLALLLFGFAWWTPIYAIPLALLFLVGFGIAMLMRRRSASGLREFRSQAESEREVEFTDRDRETLYDRH